MIPAEWIHQADERIARWLGALRGDGLHVDGDRVELGGLVVSICPWWDGPQSRARVEAQLERKSDRLRPGMEGVGKVYIGERKLIWIWTHGFVDWLRLALWRWWP